jgi:hypothetical protein
MRMVNTVCWSYVSPNAARSIGFEAFPFLTFFMLASIVAVVVIVLSPTERHPPFHAGKHSTSRRLSTRVYRLRYTRIKSFLNIY